MTDRCRSCHAPIRWIRTLADKLIPLDANEDGSALIVEDGNVRTEKVTELGITRSRATVLGPLEASTETDLYRSHFATCPNAGEWRTKQ